MADDDGGGTVTTLQALIIIGRALVQVLGIVGILLVVFLILSALDDGAEGER